MNYRIPLRTVIGLSGILLLALYSSLQSSTAAVNDPAQIAALQQRLQGVVRDVPRDAMLAYVSDVAPDESTIYGIQYVLAPRFIVKDSRPHRLVLGNFRQPVDYAEFARARGWIVVKEYPQGVVLFEKRPE
ncbi:MAG: hypothetical protein ABIR70_15495 [Bryobacteraceae bacterium]